MAALDDLQLDRNLYKAPLEGQTWDASIIAAQNADNPIDPIATGNAATDINQGSVTVDGAQLTPGSPIPQSAFNIANLGWTQTSVFTSASLNTVTWTSGIFTSADGVSRSISSGTTGVMAALTYVYLDINVSSTAYQTTTNQSNVIGPGKVLIAVAQNQAASATFNTVQTELITANNIFVNTLSAISANLGAIIAGSININNKAMIDSAGQATFIGVASLNMKAYTNFESSGRFILTGADTTPTFGNNGMVVAPGAVGTKWSRALWWVTSFVFSNNASFTCGLTCLGGFTAGDGAAFVGLGSMTMTGNGVTETGRNYCGFEFKKISGTTTVIAIQCDGGGTASFSSTLQTLVNGDTVELFIRMTSSGINYYTRLNGGAISSATSLTTHMPSGSENNITFETTNQGSPNDFQLQYQCAAYEH